MNTGRGRRFTAQGIIVAMLGALIVTVLPAMGGQAAVAVTPGQNGRILYATDTSPSQIVTLDPDGTARSEIVNDSLQDAYPEWSPDGTKIVFSKLTAPNNPDGS